MPNIKSAKKRVLVNQKKTEQNKNILSAVKTEIKKIENLVKENKLEEAKTLLPHAFALIDSAASKNIIHANNAANKKARLAKKVNVAPAKIKEEVKAEPVKEVAPAEEVKAEETVATEEPAKKPAARKPRAKKTAEETAAEEPAKKPAARKPRAKKTADAE